MAKKNPYKYKKGDIVKVNAMEGISEYLHGLEGPIYLAPKREKVTKRTKKSNWNPRVIAWNNIYYIDFTDQGIPKRETTNPKFQLPEHMITLVKEC